jgi:hypothetical protein
MKTKELNPKIARINNLAEKWSVVVKKVGGPRRHQGGIPSCQRELRDRVLHAPIVRRHGEILRKWKPHRNRGLGRMRLDFEKGRLNKFGRGGPMKILWRWKSRRNRNMG